MFKHLMVAGIMSSATVAAMPVQAANCANRDMVVERLETRYSESFAAGGLQTASDKKVLVEVWASEKTGTFTVMLTTPEGLSCVVATGTDWHQSAFEPVPEGESS